MGYFLILLYAAILLYALSLNNVKAFKLLIIICFFQNFGLVLVSRFLNGTQYTIMILLKEIYVALLLLKLLFRKRKISQDITFCLVAVLILVGLMLIHGQGEMKGRLASLRQLYLPFLFYAVGRLADLSKDDIKDLSRCFVRICIISVGFGIIEYFLSEKLWVSLGIGRFLNLKGVGRYLLSNGMPRSFYSFDLGLGYRVRRMASFLADPVIMGQLLAFGFIVSSFSDEIYKKRHHKLIFTIILGLGIILCMAKGGIVIASVSFCILLRDVEKKKFMSSFLLVTVGLILVIYFGFAIREELSVSSHYNGLITGIQSLKTNLLGSGIGSAGNHAKSFGAESIQSVSGGESYIGGMLAQTGLIGLFLNIVIMVYTTSKDNFNRETDIKINNIARVLILVLFITSFVNYSAISFTSCFIYFIFSGATKTNKGIKRRFF